jgi:uncharacterized membrane protein (UPF0127 family)
MELIVNNNLFNVKCVMTSKDIQKGMMGKKFNKDFDGMLFMMKNGDHSFWMKSCIIPLDIIFIKNNRITKIHNNCKPCTTPECDRYKGSGDMVLELKGGTCIKYDITEGDTILLQD